MYSIQALRHSLLMASHSRQPAGIGAFLQPLLALAHRLRCAAAMRSLASGLNVRPRLRPGFLRAMPAPSLEPVKSRLTV
jgi:hypothetical protein